MNNENEEININDHIINTIYVTNRKDNKPQLMFNSKNDIDIDIHVQLAGLDCGEHELLLTVLKNNINSPKADLLVTKKYKIDTSRSFEEDNMNKKALYIGEFSYRLTATNEELKNSSVLDFFITVDNKCTKSILAFVGEKDG